MRTLARPEATTNLMAREVKICIYNPSTTTKNPTIFIGSFYLAVGREMNNVFFAAHCQGSRDKFTYSAFTPGYYLYCLAQFSQLGQSGINTRKNCNAITIVVIKKIRSVLNTSFLGRRLFDTGPPWVTTFRVRQILIRRAMSKV